MCKSGIAAKLLILIVSFTPNNVFLDPFLKFRLGLQLFL